MKMMLRAVVALLFLFLFTKNQKGWCQLPTITFELITSKEGLPSNSVFSATRDQLGFMWFGTRQCPLRYDGVTFKSFNDYTTNFVTGIEPDESNNIWLSSDRSGVSKIDLSTMRMGRVLGDSDKHVGSTGDFYIDVYDQGWFSDHHGVNRLDLKTGKRKHYPFRQTNFVWLKGAFVEDLDSNLWVIGRDNGLFRYDRQRDTLICVLGADSPAGQLKDMLMSKATRDQDGFLWIGTYNLGLIKFDPRTHAFELFETGRMANKILAVEEGLDENGKRILWVGDSHGLGIFRPEQKRFFFFPDILPKSYEVNFIYRDQDGIVWVCTSDGIIKYHPLSNVIQVITIPQNILPQALTVNVVHQDNRPGFEHIFYLGMSNNVLLRWDRQKNSFSKIVYPSAAAETRWIEQRKDGTLWIGTNRWDYQRPGIFVYHLLSGKFLNPPLARITDQFFSVPFFMYGRFQDSKLWVGNSDEGIHAVDETSQQEITPWTKEVMRNVVQNNNLINDMMIDTKGRLWIGCYKGVYYYDDVRKEFVRADPETLPAGVDDPTVNTLLEDHNGNVWAARWGSITMMPEVGKISKVVNAKDGFSDREIKGLVEDFQGNLWVGNHEGLYCINTTNDRLIRFTMNDGLLSNNTTGRVYITHNKRELLVGHIQGFNLVKVGDVLKRLDPPPLVVNSFKIHHTEYLANPSESIRLQPSQDVFSIDFIALNYRKQDDNQYAYYLEGFEKDWNYIGSKHVANYTNLNPGEYILHMKAGDALGNWNEDTLDLKIEVLPAFYQTVWFKILISLFIAGVLYAFYQYRINQLLHLQRVRNRISADLHDELGSTLSGISIMGSLAKKELPVQHASSALVDRIMDDVRQISGSLDDIVWNISPKNDSLSSLIARMTRYASELFEAKQIAFKFDIPERLDDVKLSMEQRRNIYLIFKEAVNNLVKYSKCTEAFVGICMDRRKILLTVEDNGVGFDPTATTDRNGIRNLKERAKSLNGVIDIKSGSGKGTSIKLEFPVAR
ncbi:sensor histidine kinase [Chryseolinea sp. H1M3-3]|uniref:sensor histidine kinase n=1 Tax=Chryseolinea sp. H1M3-3 TaxID=3034144 RepID=UPI0023EDC298|nr:sensor histidine kinase [Chryseolinea sp. H1M3-3]